MIMKDFYPYDTGDDGDRPDPILQEQLDITQNRLFDLTDQMLPSTGYELTITMKPSYETRSLIEAHTSANLGDVPINVKFCYDETGDTLIMQQVTCTTRAGNPLEIIRMPHLKIGLAEGDYIVTNGDRLNDEFSFDEIFKSAEMGRHLFGSLKIPDIPTSDPGAHRSWLTELVSKTEGYTLTESMTLTNSVGDYDSPDGEIIIRSESELKIYKTQHIDSSLREERGLVYTLSYNTKPGKVVHHANTLSCVDNFTIPPILSSSTQMRTAEDDPFVVNYQYTVSHQPQEEKLDTDHVLRWRGIIDIATKAKDEVMRRRRLTSR